MSKKRSPAYANMTTTWAQFSKYNHHQLNLDRQLTKRDGKQLQHMFEMIGWKNSKWQTTYAKLAKDDDTNFGAIPNMFATLVFNMVMMMEDDG